MPILLPSDTGREQRILPALPNARKKPALEKKKRRKKSMSDLIIPEIIKDLPNVTDVEKRAELIGDACLDIAGMESIQRAIWIKTLSKASKLDKKVIEGKVKDKEKILEDKKPEPTGEIDELFYEPNLLANILQDIDADHKLDYYEKAALFLVRLTGELPSPSDRKSAALKGDSSSGKDNIMAAVLRKFPEESNKLLTHNTAAALRKSLDDVRCYAFSEINAHRENGANKDIIETFKQLAEGGINAEICDKQTGEVIKLKSDQKTLMYGTTEVETDEELHTRYIVIPLRSEQEKNRTVVKSVLEAATRPKKSGVGEENWCSRSIRLLDHEIDVIIPFANLLLSKVKDDDGKEKELFDYAKPRIMRDVKRLISITKAVTWLYQKQRVIKEHDGKKYLLAEPSDFLTAYEITSGFFNLTYSGLDHRLEACYKRIQELEGKHDEHILAAGYDSQYFGWVVRHVLADDLGIQNVKTIKSRLSDLKDFQLVETHYEWDKPNAYLVRGTKRGTKRVSMAVSYHPLVPLLTAYLTPSCLKSTYEEKVIRPVVWKFWDFTKTPSVYSQKLPPSKLGGLKIQNTQIDVFSSEEVVE